MPGDADVTLHAVGDIGLHGRVAANIARHGGAHPFAHVAPLLSRGDIVFGNLEKPFRIGATKRRYAYQAASSWAHQDGVAGLRLAGFTLLSLANNHILDLGPAGLADTQQLLDANGILHVGAGRTLAEARRPVIVERKGVRIGFLAYAEDEERSAGEDRCGAAPLRPALVLEDLAALRAKADVVVLSLHFGLMYTDYPRPSDQAAVRSFIDHGASLVLGHHPHVLQGIERYHGGVAAYSLGEFVYDPAAGNVYARTARETRRESVILTARLSASRPPDVEIVPVLANAQLQPEVRRDGRGTAIAERVAAISAPLAGAGVADAAYWEHASQSVVPHKIDVLAFHLRRGNLRYLLGRVVRVRPAHLKMLLAFVRSAARTRLRRDR